MKKSVPILALTLAFCAAAQAAPLTVAASAKMPQELKRLNPSQIASTCTYRLLTVARSIASKQEVSAIESENARKVLAYSFAWHSAVNPSKTPDPSYASLRNLPMKRMLPQAAWCLDLGKLMYEDMSPESQEVLAKNGIALFSRMRADRAERESKKPSPANRKK